MSERKYRQRGYMEDEPRPPERGGPRSAKDGPRGRGLGAPTREVFRCRDCGREQALLDAVAVDAACSGCGAALHACVNCAHFDTAARNECRKPVPERIRSKTKPNQCELYAPKVTLESDAGSGADRPSDPRAAFDALFS